MSAPLKSGESAADHPDSRHTGWSLVRENESGLSLIEVLVALLVLGVVLAAMASVAITSMQSIRGSERVVHATQLGNEVVERLLMVPFDDLGDYDGVVQPETREGIDYTVTTEITPEVSGQVEYRHIVVRLAWSHRGEPRTARTQAVRSQTMTDDTLIVSVVPDVITLSASGENNEAFEVIVEAEEPQTSVKLSYVDRDGNDTPAALLTTSDDRSWSKSFGAGAREFRNGGTIFSVTAKPADGGVDLPGVGRALFLHELDIRDDRIEIEPLETGGDREWLAIHPTDGVCTFEGDLALRIRAEVVGAVGSDPLNLHFLDEDGEVIGEVDEGAEEPQGLPFTSESSIMDGASYLLELEPEDLPVTHGDSALRLRVSTWRSADEIDERLVIVLGVNNLDALEPCP